MIANQAAFPISRMARVLGVLGACYYASRKRSAGKEQKADTTLLRRVRTIHASSRGPYGATQVHAELRAGGEKHGCKRIARLIRAAGLVGASNPITTPQPGADSRRTVLRKECLDHALPAVCLLATSQRVQMRRWYAARPWP